MSTTVTGTLQNPDTTAAAGNTFARFWLRGCNGGQPRVNGTALIAPDNGPTYFVDLVPNASGVLSGTLYSNDVNIDTTLTPNQHPTWYGVQIYTNGIGGAETSYNLADGVTFNLNSATPITTIPVVAAPTGDIVYVRKDDGNGPFSLHFKNLNNIRFADQFSGADIGAKINAAFADGGNQCCVYVSMPPGGIYNYSTTIVMPVGFYGQLSLIGPMDVELHYTGSGDALQAFSAVGADMGNITIENLKFSGTSSAVSGIHVKGFNGLRMSLVSVTGFTNGDAFFNEGVNQVDCWACTFDRSYNGIHNVGVVISATNFSVNASRFLSGQIAFNLNFGIFEDASIGTTVFPNQNNLYLTTLENNGSNDVAWTVIASGAVRAANVVTITVNVAHGIPVGKQALVNISGVPVGANDFNGRWYVTATTTTAFTYAQVGANETQSGGTVLQQTGNVFVQGGTGINFSNAYMEYTGANVRPSNVYFGDSKFSPSNPIIEGVWFGSVGSTNSIDNFNSNGLKVSSCREDAALTNFLLNGAASRKLNLGQNIAPAVTNYFAGSDNGLDSVVIFPNGSPLTTVTNGQGPTIRGYGFNGLSGLAQDLIVRTRSGGTNNINFQDITGVSLGFLNNTGQLQLNGFWGAELGAPSGAANVDRLWGDSTAHRWKMNNNNGGADTVVGAASTDTLTNKTLASPLNGFTTVAQTVSLIVAKVDSLTNAANVGSTLLLTAPASGMYRVSGYAVVTQQATTSSTLPNILISWTDNDTNVVTAVAAITANSAGTPVNPAVGFTSENISGAISPGSGTINVRTGTAINWSTANYASVGGTPMQYAVHIKLEYLGN